MSWLLAFLGFAVLIVLHELGHFAAAKWVGMRVERFSLFFGPPIWKTKRGETEYQLASIPLGGYVKITGMNPEEELAPELKARSYAGSPVWKRIFVIAAGPFVNVVIAFVLLAGIFLVQGRPVPAIGVAEIEGSGPSSGKLRPDDRIVRVTLPAGTGSADASASVARTLPGDEPGISLDERDRRVVAITDLIATGGCGARDLGTKGADGRVQVARCDDPRPFDVTVLRGGQELTTQITPQYDTERKRYRLGLSFSGQALVDAGLGKSATESVSQMWLVTTRTIEAMVKVVYDPQARKEVSSVVGGYETTRQSFEIDTAQAIRVLAFISLSLAIINLFPFLPLDGGHIFWALVEKARGGRPVSLVVLERATIVGFALVLMLFAIGLNNDLNRIFDGTGFGVR